jgi:hypothetical protein
MFFFCLENSAAFYGLRVVKLLMVTMEDIYFNEPSHLAIDFLA